MQKKSKVLLYGIFAGILIVSAIIAGVMYMKAAVLDNLDFKITADKIYNGCIEADSGFIVTAGKNYPNGVIKKILSLEPSVDYSVSKTANAEYLITPKEVLKGDSIYNIKIKTDENLPALSWAFQTKSEFKINSTIPDDVSTYADVNSGIVMFFSMPVNSIEQFFEISPNVTGEFEYTDKKVIFKPSALEYDKAYTVTLKKGLKSVSGEVFGEDHSFSFRTMGNDSNNQYLYMQNDYQESFTSESAPKIVLGGSSLYKNSDFTVTTYKFNSLNEFVNAAKEHYNSINAKVGNDYDHYFDLSKYEKVMSFTTKPVFEEYNGILTLNFPDKLSEGWYITDISAENKHFQKMIQISNISTYILSLNNETKVWCNDTETGEAVTGATVKIGEFAALTDKDGIASFSIDSDKRSEIYITSEDGKEFGGFLNITSKKEADLESLYYMYLYTDRSSYLPTDTINYWGTIIPRNSETKLPDSVSVVMNEKEYRAKIESNGVFSGKIDIVNYSSTWLGLQIKIGEKMQYMRDIQVSDYTKPVYNLSASFDKEYYKANDKINLTVKGTFFDGTSAEGLKIELKDTQDNSKIVTLDGNGEATATIKENDYDKSGDARYAYAQLKVAGIDENSVYYGHSAAFFPTDYHVDAEWREEGNASKLTIKTNKVDYNAINSGIIDYQKIYSGEAFDLNLNAKVIRTKTIKKPSGESYYNYYTNTSEPIYKYEYVDEILEEFPISVNKTAEMKLNYNDDDVYSYKIELSYVFPDGYKGSRIVYLFNDYRYFTSKYYLDADKTVVSSNETTDFILKSKNYSTDNVKMIYFVTTDKINEYAVSNNGKINVKMRKELMPNYRVNSVCFDGKNIYRNGAVDIYYNTEEKKLKIDIDTDKEGYKPEEEVKVNINVKNKDNEPVKANLLVSVVDEEVLLDKEKEQPLNLLYSKNYCWPVTFTSNPNDELFEGGEGGGGGGETRNTFVDVLEFTSIETDRFGNASLTFKTSDNLTSWRITAIAITEDIEAGCEKKNITTSIPFFVNQVMNEKYTVYDDVSLTARVAGNASMLISSFVNYEVAVTGEGFNETKKLELKPNEMAKFNFGKLKSGKYEVTVKASSEKYSDSITKTINVVESLQEVNTVKRIEISELGNIDALRYPVTLTFYDKDNKVYFDVLDKVIKNSNGSTIEQNVARNIAYKKLNEFYGKDEFPINKEIIVQSYEGGVKNYDYFPSSPLITAQICICAPEYMNEGLAANYFENIIKNEESALYDITASYMGLATLKRPVLNDIKYLLDNNNGLEIEDKVNLINALALIGDTGAARTYYEKEFSRILFEKGEYKYISSEFDFKSDELTSRLVPMLSLTRHPDKDKVLKYVIDTEIPDYISVMDLLIYANSHNPQETNSFFSYNLNGKIKKVDFSKQKVEVLKLTEDQLRNFKIVKQDGEIGILAQYTGGVNELSNVNGNATINKSVTGSNKLGEYRKVTLKVSVPDRISDYYILTDVIPISSRFTSRNDDFYENGYNFIGYEKQKVSFVLDTKKKSEFEIAYKIRNVLPGESNVECAYINDDNGIIQGKSNVLTVITE